MLLPPSQTTSRPKTILLILGAVFFAGAATVGVLLWNMHDRTAREERQRSLEQQPSYSFLPQDNTPSSANDADSHFGQQQQQEGMYGSQTPGKVFWMQGGPEGLDWSPSGTPPACPDPMNLPVPIDLKLATSILYPGQTRGGDYKPHGGFRFDHSKNEDITVTAPIDADLVDGARYTVDGELQYSWDFISACGIKYRLGHLLTLSPQFAALADKLPPAPEHDSHTYSIDPPVSVPKGTVIATAVGMTHGGVNTFLDWGVYDLRKPNEASKDAIWAAAHHNELSQHATCWFDLLSSENEATVRALPSADSASGKTSDYCK